jgi:hypothetical protein
LGYAETGAKRDKGEDEEETSENEEWEKLGES